MASPPKHPRGSVIYQFSTAQFLEIVIDPSDLIFVDREMLIEHIRIEPVYGVRRYYPEDHNGGKSPVDRGPQVTVILPCQEVEDDKLYYATNFSTEPRGI